MKIRRCAPYLYCRYLFYWYLYLYTWYLFDCTFSTGTFLPVPWSTGLIGPVNFLPVPFLPAPFVAPVPLSTCTSSTGAFSTGTFSTCTFSTGKLSTRYYGTLSTGGTPAQLLTYYIPRVSAEGLSRLFVVLFNSFQSPPGLLNP